MTTVPIPEAAPLQKALFRCVSRGAPLYSVVDWKELLDSGLPVDPANGEPMEYLGMITGEIPVGMYAQNEQALLAVNEERTGDSSDPTWAGGLTLPILWRSTESSTKASVKVKR